MSKLFYAVLLTAAFVMSGCSSQPEVKTSFQNHARYSYSRDNNPTQFRYKPVIGTKQDDTKVMIDMGQWAKIWIKNYRNKNKTFVASHSIVTMVRAPGFIAGEEIPRRSRDASYNTYGGRTFTFRSSDLIYDDSSMGSEGLSDSQIKEYVNNYEYSRQTKHLPPQKREDIMKKDAEIKRYIKEERARLEQKKQKKLLEKAARKKELDGQVKNSNTVSLSDCPDYMTKDECKKGSLK